MENENLSENIPSWNRNQLDLSPITSAYSRMRQEIAKVVVGQHEMIDLLFCSILSSGHVLIEGVPGIAKTLTAKLLARTIDIDFNRIQFTPDMMPADVVGTTVFNLKNAEFMFNKGPIFSNLVLIDEINRAPAKTQAALFEVMEEYQVTVDGKTYPMSQPFLVVATQNPIEQEGTYKLPEAQLDRFLFRIIINYPGLSEEKTILRRFAEDFNNRQMEQVNPVIKGSDILEFRKLVEKIHIREDLLDYIAAITVNTRDNGDLYLGASPRASLAIMKSAKAMAAINGRDFVTPDDIRSVALPVLNHRLVLMPEREMEGVTISDVVKQIVAKVEVPR